MKKLLDYLPNKEAVSEGEDRADMTQSPRLQTFPKPLSERKLEDIETIATTIRDVLDDFMLDRSGKKSKYRINKIILFGSHAKGTWVNDPANGYVSDYDILVIVNQIALVEEYEIWQAVEDKVKRKVKAPLGLLVHTQKDVSDMLHQGHYFFKDIREEGIELFSANGKELPLANHIPQEEQVEIANKHFKIWFESSTRFLTLSQDSFKREWLNETAFLLHQASEHFFCCTLLVCTNYMPKTHNLEHLRSLCAQQNPEFALLFPADTKEKRRSFQRLKNAYVDGRYSEHYVITLDELNYLASEVETLQRITEQTCQQKIQEYQNGV
ncbi:HEPN domain-containing protein [Marinomonas transparens]|uniref:HEPN domain-containing protein n=1 Tax=Marinomonas transparens TaxID=2795388 RepID=A0A934JJW6_9GAMM|nr:HEPN domain-containing protein [Marinomonas transparens]MBJ7537465.1 HEPN domain-containing protein [Marinomonas transparens]